MMRRTPWPSTSALPATDIDRLRSGDATSSPTRSLTSVATAGEFAVRRAEPASAKRELRTVSVPGARSTTVGLPSAAHSYFKRPSPVIARSAHKSDSMRPASSVV